MTVPKIEIDFKPLKTWKFWREIIIVVLAMQLTSAAVYYFVLPANLIMGSVSGVAMVISGLFAQVGITVKVSLVITILNVLLLILAYALLGGNFGFKTALASVLMGPQMDLCEAVLPLEKLLEPGMTTIMGDLWLDLLTFVLIVSVTQAILFSINASSGGLDIVGKIISKFTYMEIGTSVGIVGFVVCLTGFAVNPLRLVIVSLIGTYLNGLIIDRITVSLDRRKKVCIISKEHERIREFIINDIRRGCTLYKVEGGYERDEKIEIQVLLAHEEFARLMGFIKDNNIQAFMTAGNVSEVYGLWREKRKK